MAAAADWQRHARLDRVDRRTDGLLQQGDRAMLTKASAHAGSFIGRPLPRFEDLRFVRGSGNYTDDVSLPDQTYAVFVRAPHAHARIVSIDTSAARSSERIISPTAISVWRIFPIRPTPTT
jgi:xanthine dehydrogenase molybdopterin-binding subunit B